MMVWGSGDDDDDGDDDVTIELNSKVDVEHVTLSITTKLPITQLPENRSNNL